MSIINGMVVINLLHGIIARCFLDIHLVNKAGEFIILIVASFLRQVMLYFLKQIFHLLNRSRFPRLLHPHRCKHCH